MGELLRVLVRGEMSFTLLCAALHAMLRGVPIVLAPAADNAVLFHSTFPLGGSEGWVLWQIMLGVFLLKTSVGAGSAKWFGALGAVVVGTHFWSIASRHVFHQTQAIASDFVMLFVGVLMCQRAALAWSKR